MINKIKVHEVNERILNELTKHVKDQNLKEFLSKILFFELEHLDEGERVRYNDPYKKLLDNYCNRKSQE